MPIERVLPHVSAALSNRRAAVLVAEPGAGKSTRVPLFLVNEPWLAGQKILMLEPRRLAARSVARYMASLLGEEVGRTVGYRVRRESRVSEVTRIEVITDGVLTRMLQRDPALEGVGCVIFDEFHERSLQADLGLALCLDVQEVLREDLCILVMSATLEAEPVAKLLGDAPVIRCQGRSFPVETRYVGRAGGSAPTHAGERLPGGLSLRAVEGAVVRLVRRALAETEGDILVFLPGAGEIRRVGDALRDLESSTLRIAPLHGGLSHRAQDEAIAPSPPGGRKVVLATSIAETSLTVEGIRVVIDSGLMRVPRYSPRTGMTRLETVRVTKASADQRRGRAGRLGPGVCYRLWTEQEDAGLVPFNRPEILEADLTSLVLELALWGVSDPGRLRWLDAPPEAAWRKAKLLLTQLGALDETGAVTELGRKMAGLGVHPRLGRMILEAIPLGLGETACFLAALLEERDIARGEGGPADADLRWRLAVVRGGKGATGEASEWLLGRGREIDWQAVQRVRAEAQHLINSVGINGQGMTARGSDPGTARSGESAGAKQVGSESDACGLLAAFAFPDRIAARRESGSYLLRNGRGAAFGEGQSLAQEPYIVAVELDDTGADSRILLAAPITIDDLYTHFREQLKREEAVGWDPAIQGVAARERVRLGAIVLEERPLANPDPQRTLEALLTGVRAQGLKLLPWSKAARRLRERLAFMHHIDSGWPDVSEEGLLRSLETWLAPHVGGMKSAADLQQLDLAAVLEGLLSWEQRRELEACAPSHIQVPSGARIPVDYSDPAAPVLAVPIQDVFGLVATPRIAHGRVPLTLHLLSPAGRPVQVTQDLASFWKETYFHVRKELKGRYPKHYWPDDPLSAPPKRLNREVAPEERA